MNSVNPEQIRLEIGINKSQMARCMGIHVNLWRKWASGEQGITAAPSRLLSVMLLLHREGRFEKYFGKYLK